MEWGGEERRGGEPRGVDKAGEERTRVEVKRTGIGSGRGIGEVRRGEESGEKRDLYTTSEPGNTCRKKKRTMVILLKCKLSRMLLA